MRRKVIVVAAASLLALSIAGCGAEPTPQPEPLPPAAENPAAGLRLAAGLHEQADGTAIAVGTLEYVDLEGGFWAVIGGTEAEGTAGEIAAVLANGADFEAELAPLAGKTVSVTGKKLDGASVRMAGPEIEMTAVEEISDTPGIAE